MQERSFIGGSQQEWLELEADLVTLHQFRSKMLEHSANQDVYDIRYIKKILKDKYGANILFRAHERFEHAYLLPRYGKLHNK